MSDTGSIFLEAGSSSSHVSNFAKVYSDSSVIYRNCNSKRRLASFSSSHCRKFAKVLCDCYKYHLDENCAIVSYCKDGFLDSSCSVLNHIYQ